MSLDNVQMTDNSAYPISVHHLLPYPISRHEAELHWEMTRQKVRARIATLPSSSFERTMLEEDERFYATFPQARQAAINAWIAQEFPYAPWAQTSSSEDTSMGVGFGGSPKACASTSVYPPPPAPDFSTFTLANALAFSRSPGLEAHAQRPLTIVYDASAKATEPCSNTSFTDYVSSGRAGSSQGCDSIQQGSASEIVSEPRSMPTPSDQESVLLALQVLAPARRMRPARNTRKVNPCPPPYTALASKKQENIYPSTFFATPPESTRTSTPASPPPEQPQHTSDWEADAVAATEFLHASGRIHGIKKPILSVLPSRLKKPDADTSPTSARPLSSRKNRLLSRLRHRSNTPSKPDLLQASSQQSTFSTPRKRPKLLRDKDGKPVMACLFCRGRKIACGPPPAGSDDPTCNQCARRGLACHYPTESRRGQRKRKTNFVNAQPNNVSTLLNLYRKAVLKGDDIHVMSDNSDSEWDGRDL